LLTVSLGMHLKTACNSCFLFPSVFKLGMVCWICVSLTPKLINFFFFFFFFSNTRVWLSACWAGALLLDPLPLNFKGSWDWVRPAYVISFSLFFFFLVGLGFEVRASCLQSRHSTAWAIPPVHFALVILEIGVSWGLSWPQIAILPISSSQVARITGVSHRCLANFFLKLLVASARPWVQIPVL
jgi:hypothetical protein